MRSPLLTLTTLGYPHPQLVTHLSLVFEGKFGLGDLLLPFGQPGFSFLTLVVQLRLSGGQAGNFAPESALLLLQGLAFVADTPLSYPADGAVRPPVGRPERAGLVFLRPRRGPGASKRANSPSSS